MPSIMCLSTQERMPDRMSADDRVRWDAIFRERQHQPYPAPDPLLLQYTPPVPDDEDWRALDLAAGLGQNGLWLAEQGYRVDIMDISRVALQRARAEMAMRNIRDVNLLQVDADQLELEQSAYMLLCVFRYLRRELFPMLREAVMPGGRIVYQTFNVRYLDILPGFNPSYLLELGELLTTFGDWQIVHHDESDHNTQLVAIRPR